MKPIVLGMSCWGERYLHSFFNYTLPSLLSEGNIPALCKHYDVRMVVHTDNSGKHFFNERNIPSIPDVMEGDKYEQIGMHQQWDLALAKKNGADYHMIMPDFVYSGNFFEGMLMASKKHKAITRLVVSTTQETIWPYLKVGMSAKELATLSLEHIHPGVRHWLVTPEGLPNTHVLAWKCKDTLRMCSPHQTVVYIANEAIKLNNTNLPLDCILDKVIDGDIYCTKPEDEMVVIEMSPRDSRKPNDKIIDLNEFIRIFKWDTKHSHKQFEIFQQETVDAIDNQGDYWDDVAISEQKSIVMREIGGL